MLKFDGKSVGLQQGDVVLFSDFETDGEMWVGSGPRQIRTHVCFSERFAAPPVIHLSLTMWDVSNSANTRMDLRSEDIDAAAFVILFRTWDDTRIARARVSWLAIGPVRDEDHWDLS